MKKARVYFFLVFSILLFGCADGKEFINFRNDIWKIDQAEKKHGQKIEDNASALTGLKEEVKKSNAKIDANSAELTRLKGVIGKFDRRKAPICEQLKRLEENVTGLQDDSCAMQTQVNLLETSNSGAHEKMQGEIEELKQRQQRLVPYTYLEKILQADDNIIKAIGNKTSILVYIYYEDNKYRLTETEVSVLNQALEYYEQKLDLNRDYELSEVIGFTAFEEKESLGLKRAQTALEKLEGQGVKTENAKTSYGGSRGEEVIIIFQRKKTSTVSSKKEPLECLKKEIEPPPKKMLVPETNPNPPSNKEPQKESWGKTLKNFFMEIEKRLPN